MNNRYKISRRILIFWTLFVGVGALLGGVCMLVDPSGKLMGMDALLPYFKVLPFSDILFTNLIFSGVMLLIVNGLTNFISAGFLFAKKKLGIVLGMVFGVTLMAWICIQFVILPTNFMSTAFFIIGLLQFITGAICLIGYKQSQFSFDELKYNNIGTDKTKLVVYFSRQGYTKKLAYQIADNEGADILELQTPEKTKGNLGFWWCGRYGMHKWGMPLNELKVDPTKYDFVIICSPTWVFGVSAPVREFCKMYSGKLKNVSFNILHFMNCKFDSIKEEVNDLLKIECKEFNSYSCHYGNIKKIQ